MKGGGEREGEGGLPLPLIYLLPCGQSWCHRVFAHPVFTSLNPVVLSKPPPSGLLCLNHYVSAWTAPPPGSLSGSSTPSLYTGRARYILFSAVSPVPHKAGPTEGRGPLNGRGRNK